MVAPVERADHLVGYVLDLPARVWSSRGRSSRAGISTVMVTMPVSSRSGKVMLALPLQSDFPTAIDGRVEKIVDNLTTCVPPSWLQHLSLIHI